MKTLFSILFVALLISCQQTNQLKDPTEVASKLNSTIVEPHLNMLAGSKMHSGSLTEQEQQELAEEGNLRLAELRRVSPFPMLKENEALSLSLQESEARYRNFVSENKGKAVLPIFRQLYAGAILNNYKLLSSDDYTKIEYYVNELIEGESFDFRTMTLSLVKLNGHADANFIKSSINRLLPIITNRVDLETVALAKIKDMDGQAKGQTSSQNPTAESKELLLGLGGLRNKLEHSDTKQCLFILNNLNSQVSNS